MIEIKTKLRKWGNSFGLVVPLGKLHNTDLKEGNEVRALIVEENKIDLKKLFGKHKFSKPTEKLIKEMDKELYNG